MPLGSVRETEQNTEGEPLVVRGLTKSVGVVTPSVFSHSTFKFWYGVPKYLHIMWPQWRSGRTSKRPVVIMG